jgi:hypothetical protein
VWEVRDANGRWIVGIPTENGKITAEQAIKRAADSSRGPDGRKVPSAPFSKTWHEFVFKRIVREAVETGKDIVGWTTGEQQAERYDLSKQVKQLSLISNGKDSGTYNLVIEGIDGQELSDYSRSGKKVTPQELEDTVGKEVAKKLIAGADAKAGPTHQTSEWYDSRPGDLKVGGEGMKGFYDKMLVDYANKFGKKYGAMVEDVTIPTGETTEIVHALPVTEAIRSAASQGFALFHTAALESEAAFASVLENFGETKNIYEAGYVLPDGRMIDFSGRNQAVGYSKKKGKYVADKDDYLKNQRGVDPREIEWDAPGMEGMDGNERMEAFIGMGAVRIDANSGLADMSAPPTPKQWVVIKTIIESSGTAWIEMRDGKRTATIEDDGNASKTLGLIRRFYDGETLGERLYHHEDAASEEMLQALAPLAAPFNTMEEFIRSTEERAGEPVSESQRGVYQAVWERAHPQAPVEQVAEKAIPLPELEEEYDHEEKIQAGAVASDPALAASMESGALSSAEVERRIEGLLPQEGRAEIQELEKEIEELQGDVMKAFTDGADWQKYIDDLQMEKVQDKAKIRKAKLIAQKWAKVEALKQEFRQKEANRRAAVKYKAAVARVIKKIMAPPPVSISYRGYAEEINRIQRGLDPAHHQTVKGNPTKWEKERQASRDFFARNPDAAALVDQKKLDKIYSTSLADMPLAELEEILEQLDGLRKLGKLKRSLQLQQRLRARNKARMILANTVLRGEPPEEVIGRAKASGPGFTAWLKTLKPDRVARLLDGALEGAAPGEFERLLWDRVNEEWEAEKKAYHARVDPVIKAMEDLKLTADPWKLAPGYTYLGERLDIRHNGKTFVMSDGNQPTLEQAMYWYIGMQNDRTARALELGNNLPKEVLDAGVELVRNNPNLKAFADIIEKDGSENFENLRQAFIDLNNFDLPAEEHYVRMRRMKISYESRDDEVTAELVGRTGSMQKFVAANPTFKRIDVPDEYQSPIDDRLFSTWLRGVEIQEAYIHKSQMIRDLQAIFGSDQVTKAVQQKFGPAMNEWIKNYINFLAAGDDYARQQGWEKLSRIMRSNAAIAWLGFNLLSAGKQLTSTLDGLAEAGPVHLLGASAEFIGNPKKLIEFVREKSATVKYRSPTQELEDLRRLDVNKYEALVKKIGQASMAMLKAEDVAASTIVWKAVYDKALAGNIEEAAAAKAADNAIVRSQPSARPQDVAEIYRSGEVAKWFTMMTSDASAKWNRLTFDVPAALVNGQLGFAAMTLIGISLSGLAIAAMSGAFSGDDDEEKKKALVFSLFSQQLESLPLVGNDFSSALQRGIGIGRKFPSSGVKLIPALTYLERVPSQFARQDWHGMAENLAEGIGTASGLPVVGPRRAVKAIQTWDWTPLLGWPVEEGTR